MRRTFHLLLLSAIAASGCAGLDATSPESSVVVANLRKWGWVDPLGTGGGGGGCEDTQVVSASESRRGSTSLWLECAPPCGDVRDSIIAEYTTYSVYPKPTCQDFTSSGGTTHFPWSALNGGFTQGNPHSPWGMIKTGLISALETTYTNYNRGAITLTSGYRCPQGNNSVSGASTSLHMQGRAADMKSGSYAWTETEFNLLKAAADDTNPFESFSWDTYPNDHHYHASW